ncbi:hypothetical protein [Brevibacterium aurantiacum]|uniref:Uncharacterized protein n=1 Tax=Brevibacterium aurantiacum TaxID=273384 RepID=A0A2A3YSP2_BREAU|nr:hypothetical protein [Brevibacterium aurantiacum]PCC42317.1 hypothetical protein CIK65_12900 [Brevibacterium aurantiacum]
MAGTIDIRNKAADEILEAIRERIRSVSVTEGDLKLLAEAYSLVANAPGRSTQGSGHVHVS